MLSGFFGSCQHCLLPAPVAAAGPLGFAAHGTKKQPSFHALSSPIAQSAPSLETLPGLANKGPAAGRAGLGREGPFPESCPHLGWGWGGHKGAVGGGLEEAPGRSSWLQTWWAGRSGAAVPFGGGELVAHCVGGVGAVISLL